MINMIRTIYYNEVDLHRDYLRAKLFLSNPPNQRMVNLRVKRFIEILVYRKIEFVFFFCNNIIIIFNIY